jgi:hypothetical protein
VNRWKEQSEGVVLPEEQAEFQRRKERFMEELGRWITPDELAEVSLRFWAISHEAVYQESFERMTLHGAEFREFCRILSQGDLRLVEESAGYDDLLGVSETNVREEQKRTGLRALLGEERDLILGQSLNPLFASTRDTAVEAGLDPDPAAQAFALVQSLETELVPELPRRWSVNPDETMRQIREHRDQFSAALRERLSVLPEDKRPELISAWVNRAIRVGW